MKKLFAIVLALVLCISVMSVVAFAAETEITITVVAPEGWAECYAYNWPETLGGWPGTKLTAGADGKYTVTVKAGFDGMVIGEGNGKPQTQDITLDQTKSEATITIGEAGADGKHTYTIQYGSGDVTPLPPAETDYYIAGDEALTGAHWEANSIKMNKGDDGIYSYTFKNLAAGEYQLKVTDGTWTKSWGGDGPDGNYLLKVSEAGDVTVKFDSNKEEIIVDGQEAPAPTASYYVAGQAALCGSDWNPSDPANKMTYADGIYTYTYKNVAAGSYQLKVTDGSWNYCCGHDGPDGNFAFEVKTTGDVVVEFDAKQGLVTIVVDGARLVGTPNPPAKTGDVSLVGVSVALLVATAGLVAVVSKKKEF